MREAWNRRPADPGRRAGPRRRQPRDGAPGIGRRALPDLRPSSTGERSHVGDDRPHAVHRGSHRLRLDRTHGTATSSVPESTSGRSSAMQALPSQAYAFDGVILAARTGDVLPKMGRRAVGSTRETPDARNVGLPARTGRRGPVITPRPARRPGRRRCDRGRGGRCGSPKTQGRDADAIRRDDVLRPRQQKTPAAGPGFESAIIDKFGSERGTRTPDTRIMIPLL